MTYEITTDNLTLTDANGRSGRRIVARMTKAEITRETQKFFSWASTPDPWVRYNRTGSHDHDRFLQHLLSAYPERVRLS